MQKGDDKTICIYMQEIGRDALLTVEEEITLAERIRRGDEKARQQLIRSNLRLVVKIAHSYARYGLPLLDLISEGNIGLMKAVDRFDPRKGGKMSTYAAWWIKQSIKRALANQSKTIRLPSHLVDKIARMRREQQRLAGLFGRDPDVEELAAALEVEESTVRQWQAVALKPASLDAPLGEDGEGSFSDLLADEKAADPFAELSDKQLRDEVGELIKRLDRREREILRCRFGLKGARVQTLEDVGKKFNVTRERVRQIQKEAVEKLRLMLEELDRPVPAGKRAAPERKDA